jgi:hypothetical protein
LHGIKRLEFWRKLPSSTLDITIQLCMEPSDCNCKGHSCLRPVVWPVDPFHLVLVELKQNLPLPFSPKQHSILTDLTQTTPNLTPSRRIRSPWRIPPAQQASRTLRALCS